MNVSSWHRFGRRSGFFALLVTAVLFALSCGSSERSTGGETHFLRLCGGDPNFCGPDLTCLCGVCTRVCAESSSCPSVSSVECSPPSCSEPQMNQCDVSCSSDADCASLSAEHRCVNGACRAGGACAGEKVSANQVLIVGDAFLASSHQITAYLEDLARNAGALATGERYRDNSTTIGNALALGGNGIETQYTSAASEADVKVVIMNGGGADLLVAACKDPSDCAPIAAAASAAEQLFAKMAAEGVAHVVYAYYPDPDDADLRAAVDALRPLLQSACDKSPVPCHFLDLRTTFAGHRDQYLQNSGLNPTAAGAQASAEAIWATMQAFCIAQ
jgi:hypothetical protein